MWVLPIPLQRHRHTDRNLNFQEVWFDYINLWRSITWKPSITGPLSRTLQCNSSFCYLLRSWPAIPFFYIPVTSWGIFYFETNWLWRAYTCRHWAFALFPGLPSKIDGSKRINNRFVGNSFADVYPPDLSVALCSERHDLCAEVALPYRRCRRWKSHLRWPIYHLRYQ